MRIPSNPSNQGERIAQRIHSLELFQHRMKSTMEYDSGWQFYGSGFNFCANLNSKSNFHSTKNSNWQKAKQIRVLISQLCFNGCTWDSPWRVTPKRVWHVNCEFFKDVLLHQWGFTARTVEGAFANRSTRLLGEAMAQSFLPLCPCKWVNLQ